VNAVGERIQNLIEIVSMEIDIFGAPRPEDRHFGTMVGDKEDVDVVRVAAVLAAVFAVFIVVVIVVVAVTTALNNNGIGLIRFWCFRSDVCSVRWKRRRQRKGIENVLHSEDDVLPPIEFVGHRRGSHAAAGVQVPQRLACGGI
jgi:hypothetical protein